MSTFGTATHDGLRSPWLSAWKLAGWLLWAASMWAAGMWACAPVPEATDGRSAEALRVSYGGCHEIRMPGPVCSLQPQDALSLWIPVATAAEVEVSLDGVVLPPERLSTERVADGWRWRLRDVPLPARLQVRRSAQSWTLQLEPWQSLDWLVALTEDLQAGDFAEARAILEARLAEAPDDGEALSMQGRFALQRDGNLELALASFDAAVADHARRGNRLSRVVDGTRAVYLLLELGEYRFAEARRRLQTLGAPASDAASDVANGAAEVLVGDPAEASYYLDYYRGVLAQRVGDLRSALEYLSSAASVAERVGLLAEQRLAEQVRGSVLAELGRSEDAAALYEHLQDSPEPDEQPEKSCFRVQQLNNQAWASLLTLEAGGVPRHAPDALLRQALDDLRGGAGLLCMDAQAEEANLQLNLALAFLHQGDTEAARRSLERYGRQASGQAKAAVALPPLQRLWHQELQARLELEEGQPSRALALYDQLAAADPAAFPAARWRAEVGRGRALRALGRRGEALAALEQAERLLDAESLGVPIHAGRDTFLSGREAAARLQVRLLLDAGRVDDAFAAARRNRARLLLGLRWTDRLARLTPAEQARWDDALAAYQRQRAQLDAEAADDWQLPADQLAVARAARSRQARELAGLLDRALSVLGAAAPTLAPLHAGELVLLYHPVARDLPDAERREGSNARGRRWVGFAATPEGVSVHWLPDPEALLSQPEQLAEALFTPVAAQVHAARRLRFLPYGKLRGVDLHVLPFERDILLAAVPVTYGLDLQAVRADSGRAEALRALLVADPLDDLPAARAEVAAVVELLQAGEPAWQLRQLQGAAADASTVRALLEEVSLFHYAGHGRFAGWSSALPLAGGGRLTVGDILALQQAPAQVVLSGCETGRAASSSAVESIGLAQAFLAAGSRVVLAAVRPVQDRAAADLVTDWYRRHPDKASLAVFDPAAGQAAVSEDPAAVLRRVQLAWRAREPSADWASFRLFEP